MSKTTWIIIGVVVVAALVVGGYYYWQQQGQTETQNQLQSAPATSNELPTSQNDTSDAALQKDAASIDAQMKGLDTDSSNANASLNDSATVQ